MLKNGLTLVAIPHKPGRALRVNLSGRLLALGALALALLIGIGSYGIYRMLWLEFEMRGRDAVVSGYLHQQIEFKKLANDLTAYNAQISRQRELDYKLRLITDLKVENAGPGLFGIGGSMEAGKPGFRGDADLNREDLGTLLERDLSRLKEAAAYQEESFNNLKAFLADQKDLLRRSPYRWPVRGYISSGFGTRTDPFTGLAMLHNGVDIVAPRGSQVVAPADGIVTYTALDPTLGNMLVIDHGYGIITRYGHTDGFLVNEGKWVKRGDPIAIVGSSGRSTGPHLHYEIHINDVAVNPQNYILK